MTFDTGELVSIIVPFYSHPEYFPQAIESALGQTYANLEIIVVDDGSPYDLDALLQPYRADTRLRVIHQENAGVAAARNTGIHAAKGAYFQFLDSDDLLAPEKIERHVAALQANPEVGLVFCPFRYLEDGVISDPVDPPIVHDRLWQPDDGRYFNTLWAANRMVVVGPMVRRAWILRANGFDTSNLTEDYELWLRLAALGCLMQNLPDALVYYRINKGGRSQDGHARARKVATRARALERFPERTAEATEWAMETWQTSFDALWRDRQETIDRQAAELERAQQLWEELHGWAQSLQETIDRQADEFAQADRRWQELHEWSKGLQETIDRQAAELEQAKRHWDSLHARSEGLQETIDRQAAELEQITSQRDELQDWARAQEGVIEQMMQEQRKQPGFALMRKFSRANAAADTSAADGAKKGRPSAPTQ